MPDQKRNVILYVLHSGEMYGTERMALATAAGLSNEFETIFIAPPGEALTEAEGMGFQTRSFRTLKDLARVLWPLLKANRSLTMVSTGPRYALVCMALNLLLFRRVKHVQMIHGGAGEKNDYARKKILKPFNTSFVVVSNWSKAKLAAYGVPEKRIEVVPNFLTRRSIVSARQRGPFEQNGVKNVVVVSRVDWLKRIDVLLDALDRRRADLAGMSFKIIGNGTEFEALKELAKKKHPNVEFMGFSATARDEMARADLLVHTCPSEPFGLVILEAMAAHIPVLLPNEGGAAGIVEDGIDGFKFRANDADHLAEKLVELHHIDAKKLNQVVSDATKTVEIRFSAESSLKRYRDIFRIDAPQPRGAVLQQARKLV